MRLILANFKQHESLDISFPDVGLVLLKGKSGIGKSTVLEAIDFVINSVGDDIVTWGKTSCSVTLELNGFSATRSKKPNSLKLIYNSETYLDDQAQEMLYKLLNINQEEFNASAYIQQGQANSLLTLKPADQLRFIQKLAESHIDPDKFKRFIQQEINIIEIQLQDTEKQIASRTLKINETHKAISLVSIQEPIKPDLDQIVLEKDLANLNNQLSKLQAGYYKLSIDLQSANKEQERINTRNSNIARLRELDQRHIEINQDIQELHSKLMAINHDLNCIDIVVYNNLLKEEELVTEAKAIVKELNDFDHESIGKVASQFCADMIQSIDQELSSTEQLKLQNNNKMKELSRLNKPVPCPACQTPLMVSDGTILAHSFVDYAQELDKCSKLSTEYTSKIQALKTKLTTYQSFHLRLQQKKQAIQSLGIDKTKKIAGDQVREGIEKHSQLSKDLFKTGVEIKTKQQELTRVLTDRSACQALLADIEPNSLDPSAIQASMAEIYTEQNQLKEQIKQTEESLTAVKLYNIAQDGFLQSQRVLTQLEAQLSQLLQEQATTQETVTSLSNKATTYLKLLDIAEKSALESIQNVLDMINISTRKYIEAMFPDTGTSVEILNTATTKKGDERAKVSLHITHQGQKIKNLKSFSGGQLSRLTLAFQLGLSDLYKCPFLLVDEGFTGVDPETQIECIEFLKQYTQDKLVLVIEHHAHEALFDEIIEVF